MVPVKFVKQKLVQVLDYFIQIYKFSYNYQSSPTEGHIWKWLMNIIEVIFCKICICIHIYVINHAQKNKDGVNQNILVLAHTIPLHYWQGGRERFLASQKTKSTSKIKLKIKSLHEALGIFILKGSMSTFIYNHF